MNATISHTARQPRRPRHPGRRIRNSRDRRQSCRGSRWWRAERRSPVVARCDGARPFGSSAQASFFEPPTRAISARRLVYPVAVVAALASAAGILAYETSPAGSATAIMAPGPAAVVWPVAQAQAAPQPSVGTACTSCDPNWATARPGIHYEILH